jgi:hypothetical protein
MVEPLVGPRPLLPPPPLLMPLPLGAPARMSGLLTLSQATKPRVASKTEQDAAKRPL